jgi:DNA repair protein RecO
VSQAPNRELCYVLKTIPYKERDLIAQMLSESRGRFSAIARNGVQSRRFGGSLDLFTCSEFEIDPKTTRIAEASEEALLGLLSSQVRHSPKTLSQSFEKLSAASCLNELLIRMLPPMKASPEVFKLYSNSLMALEELPEERGIALVNAFILKMTQWLGVQPALTRCLHCEKPLNEVNGESVYPQINQGAWICGSCTSERSPNPLSKTLILDAYHSMLHPIRKIEFQATREDHEHLLAFLEAHLQYFVPGFDKTKVSSFRFLKSARLPF